MFKKLTLFMMMLSLSGLPLFAQSSIVPYNPDRSADLFIDEALRDPTVENSFPIPDDAAFDELLAQTKAWRSELPKTSGIRRVELLVKLYQAHASFSYFLEDVRAGRIVVKRRYTNIPARLANHQRAIKAAAAQVLRFSRNAKITAQANYHLLSLQYLNTNIKSSSVAQLLKLKPKLNSYLRRRVDFLNGSHLIMYKNSNKGRSILRSVITSLPVEASAGARLILARSYAGLTKDYRRSGKLSTRYKSYTQTVSNNANRLSASDRSAVLSHLTLIWRTAEPRSSWSKTPFSLKHFEGISLTTALVEKAAIEDMKKKRYDRALSKYRALATVSKGSAIEERLDMRIIDLYRKSYQTKSDTQKIQAVFVSYEKKYQSKGKASTARSIRGQHQSLVMQKVAAAKGSRVSKNSRTEAIKTAYRYLQISTNAAEKIKYELDIASLYDLNKDYSKAVAVYLGIEQKVEASQKIKYLSLAINTQKKASAWPLQAPWNGIKKGHTADRTKLLALITRKYQQTGHWREVAHMGLLQINLGQIETAFELFNKQINSAPKASEARYASGLMVAAFQGAKNWDSLESLSRMLLQKRVQPLFKGRSYNPYMLLAEALFEGGKAAFAKSQWAKSAEKLKEFIASYKKDPRRKEGMFVLGQAFHNNANHPESIETYIALVKEYPANPYEKKALLLGGSWALPMAYEEQTIFFYQRFVNRYSSDKKALEVRPLLKELYIGRQLYGDAARIMENEISDRRLLKKDRIEQSLNVMQTEEKFGEIKFAMRGADAVRRLAPNDADAMTEVLAFETRVAASRKDYKKLRAIEKALTSMTINSRDHSEALAQVRFILAETSIKATKNEFFNLELTDPSSIIKKQMGLFQSMKKTFDNVCDAGVSSYCGPAMIMLSQATKYTLDAIENITIPQTLDEKTVDRFETSKFNHVNYLDQVASKAIDQALGLSEDGETTPDWSREIRWDVASDWNFEQTANHAGNGYVQWSADQVAAESNGFELDVGGL